MRVFFLHTTPFPKYSGGIDNWLFHIIQQLDKTDLKIVIIAPSSDSDPFYDIAPFRHLALIETVSITGHARIYRWLKTFLPFFSFLPVVIVYLRWSISAYIKLGSSWKRVGEI